MFKQILFLALLLTATGCEKIALLTTPKKEPKASHNELSKKAQTTFWTTLHNGQYESIPLSEKLLLAAYLENPNDPQLASHLGFLHIWKITERQRVKPIPPTIVDEIILAKKYFADSALLNPNDARIQGFLGDSELIEGEIFHDDREQVSGYFRLKHAISMWPEFNYFTAGYPMSSLAPDDKQFKEALAWQWKTLDLCAGTKVSRSNPDFRLYFNRMTQKGPERACWNSWIAPHNFEGFFLNMGDMLVKSGDVRTGVKIYRNAQMSKDYASWPYKQMLEERIAQAEKNAVRFRLKDSQIMFSSGRGCVVCHQR